MPSRTIIKSLGIIEAGGTGKELAEVFKSAITSLCRRVKTKPPTFVSFQDEYKYNPSTFWEIRNKFSRVPYSNLLNNIKKEEKDVTSFLGFLSRKKTLGVFRTAINAETLYQVRMDAKMIKGVTLKIKDKELLFVRDQIQGFYSNDKVLSQKGKLSINTSFSASNFDLLLKFVKEKFLSKSYKPNLVLFIYKYHIFGLELDKLISESYKKQKISCDFQIMQPDSGMHFLLHDWMQKKYKKVLVICGNEVGDVLLESLIHFYKLGTKESVFTNEYCLKYSNLEVLQTMHGSVDSHMGKNTVNPTATLRAAAYALENWLLVPNAIKRMDRAISKVRIKKLTSDFVRDAIEIW